MPRYTITGEYNLSLYDFGEPESNLELRLVAAGAKISGLNAGTAVSTGDRDFQIFVTGDGVKINEVLGPFADDYFPVTLSGR